jgi:hypothetical protein
LILSNSALVVKFSWIRKNDVYSAISSSNVVTQDGVDILSCLLMDDGGLPALATVPWLVRGIEQTNLVKSGKLETFDWVRETWGVEFRGNQAKVYSLLEESYFQVFMLDQFLVALEEWHGFIIAAPDGQGAKTVDCSVRL